MIARPPHGHRMLPPVRGGEPAWFAEAHGIETSFFNWFPMDD